MNYIKFNPFLPIQEGVDDLVKSIFDSRIGDIVGSDFVSSIPKANVVEEKDGFRVELAAPGLSKDSFQLKIEKDQLIVSTEVEENVEDSSDTFTRREFNFRGFRRTFPLHKDIDREKVTAAYRDGILTIRLPYVQGQADQNREIVID